MSVETRLTIIACIMFCLIAGLAIYGSLHQPIS